MKNNIAIVGTSLTDEMKNSISSYGYTVFTIKPNSLLSPAVASHPDLSLFIIKNTLFTPRCVYDENRQTIDKVCEKASLELVITSTTPHAPYPHEAAFCAINVNDQAIIANKKVLAKEIASFCDRENIPIIHTAQGYSRCTSLSFNDCLISADASSLKAAELIGLKTLKISQGGVELAPYDYGFIGGACGFDGKKIYFCGDISSHPDHREIIKFIEENNASAVSLASTRLLDVGSIFFI